MRLGTAALVLCSLLALTGCWNNRPIETRSMVLVMGVDPGPQNSLGVSLQIPSPSALGAVTGTSPPKKPTSFVLAGRGTTLSAALADAQAKSEHEIYLGQMQAIVLSTHLNETQFHMVEDFLTRYGPTDKSAYLAATEEKASDILAFQPVAARFSALYLHTLFSCKNCQVAHLNRMVWDQEKVRISPAADAWVPLIATDSDFHVDRVAIYRKTHPALLLSPQETIVFAHMLGLTHKAVETLATRWGSAGLRSVRAIPSTRARIENGKLVADVSLKVQASLESFPLGKATLGNMKEVQTLLNQSLAQRASALVAKLQMDGLNPLRLGKAVLWHHPELTPKWPELYRNARITTHVSSHITDVGDAT